MGEPAKIDRPEIEVLKDVKFDARATLLYTAVKFLYVIVSLISALLGSLYLASPKSGKILGLWQVPLAVLGCACLIAFATFNIFSISERLTKDQEKKAVKRLFSKNAISELWTSARSAFWLAVVVASSLILYGTFHWLSTMPLWAASIIFLVIGFLVARALFYVKSRRERWTKDQKKEAADRYYKNVGRGLWILTKVAFWLGVMVVAGLMLCNWLGTVPSWAAVIIFLLVLILFKR